MFIHQLELKRRFLFSSLLALSVNTILEEDDFIYNSSSDDAEDELLQTISEKESSSVISDLPSLKVDNTDKNFISNQFVDEINSDLISNNQSSSIINTVSTKDIGIQTQLSDFEKVVYSNLNDDIRAKADLSEFGTDNKNTLITESRDLIEKGVQTKPNLHLDLSSSSFDVNKEITTNSILDILPEGFIDPLILEAYVPIPEAMNLSDLSYAISLGLF